MSISYDPLWQMLNELNVTKMEFAKMIGISNATLAKLSKNEPITLTTVDKICNRFDCKIENVVKHILDVKINKAKFIVEKGMIVLADDLSSKEFVNNSTHFYRHHKRPHVVLDILSPDMDTDSRKIEAANYDDLSYAVAPIYTKTSSYTNSPLDLKFDNVKIDGVDTCGIIAFGRMIIMDSGLFEKKLGLMPEQYVNKFHKILCTMNDVIEVIDEN